MRWVHAGLGSVLALGGIGLTVGFVWAAGLPACAELVPRHSGWIYTGVVLFAGAVVTAVIVGAQLIEDAPILRRIYFGVALVEAATAFVLAFYISVQYARYACG